GRLLLALHGLLEALDVAGVDPDARLSQAEVGIGPGRFHLGGHQLLVVLERQGAIGAGRRDEQALELLGGLLGGCLGHGTP
ncbi:hypothetical protein HMPREF0077_0733, partial [Anaerococcus tetradius ATCC 35098]